MHNLQDCKYNIFSANKSFHVSIQQNSDITAELSDTFSIYFSNNGQILYYNLITVMWFRRGFRPVFSLISIALMQRQTHLISVTKTSYFDTYSSVLSKDAKGKLEGFWQRSRSSAFPL